MDEVFCPAGRLGLAEMGAGVRLIVSNIGSGAFKPQAAILEVQARDSGAVQAFAPEQADDTKGELVFSLPADALRADGQFQRTSDIFLTSGKKRLRIKCETAHPPRLRTPQSDLMPFATVHGNLSICSIRRTPRKKTSAGRISIIVAQINFSGGKTKAMLVLAEQLARAGYDVTVVALRLVSKPPLFPVPESIRFEYMDFGHWQRPGEETLLLQAPRFVASPRTRKRIARYVQGMGDDVVYLPDYDSDLYKLIFDNLRPGVQLIIGDHNPRRNTFVAKTGVFRTSNIRDRLFLKAINRAAAVHVINPLVEAVYRANTKAKVYYIPNTAHRRAEPRTADQIFASRSAIVLSRLVSSKQIDHAVRAFGRIAARRKTWRLDIYGRGPEADNLQALIEELQLTDQVFLRGFDPDIEARLNESAFILATTAIEALSLAYLEAMGTGTPMLTYDGNATARFTIGENGERGFIAADGDIDALSVAMNELMQMIEERQPVVTQKARDAYDFTAAFTDDAVVNLWQRALKDLMGHKKHQSARRSASKKRMLTITRIFSIIKRKLFIRNF